MDASHRVIGPSTIVAWKNSCQSTPPPAWKLQKISNQISELQQQTQTTNIYDHRRLKQLGKKLRQLERQQGLGSPPTTESPSPADCSPPVATSSPVGRSRLELNPLASEWSPRPAAPSTWSNTPRLCLRPDTALLDNFPASLPSSPDVEPRIARFAIAEPDWNLGCAIPHASRLLGGSLLGAIHEIGDSTPSFENDNLVHDNDSDDLLRIVH